jgi:hypothetical protein
MRQDYRDYASRADVLMRCGYVMAVDVIIDDGTSIEVKELLLALGCELSNPRYTRRLQIISFLDKVQGFHSTRLELQPTTT